MRREGVGRKEEGVKKQKRRSEVAERKNWRSGEEGLKK